METEVLWLLILGAALLAAILSGVPVFLSISGAPLLVAVAASYFGAFDLTYLLAYPQRAFGVMGNSILIAVPLFVLMGVLLERSRVAERMLLNLTGMMGGSSSMLALSVLIVATLIAASTGIIGATIIMLGMIALPALLSAGVSARLSSGLICASGTLGQIIPPSIVLILLGDQVSNVYMEAQREAGNFAPDPVTVSDLFAGALLPGLLLVVLYALYALAVLAFTKGRQTGAIEPLPDTRRLAITASVGWRALLADTAPPVLLILAVLGSILFGVATPTEAASVGVLGTLLITAANLDGAGRGLRLAMAVSAASAFGLVALRVSGVARIDFTAGFSVGPGQAAGIVLTLLLLAGGLGAAWSLWRGRVLRPSISKAVEISAMIFAIVLAASMLSLVFRGFNGDDIVHQALTSLPGDKWGMLFVTMLVIFLLGFVLEFIEIVLIVIPILGPVLLATDIDPIWFAILVALNLQTSFLTPPFGFALFYYRSVAPASIPTTTIYLSIIPFVIIQLIAVALVVAFPALATWLPSVLFR
jgi:tripartite ATP-independent transporter DctM subunit